MKQKLNLKIVVTTLIFLSFSKLTISQNYVFIKDTIVIGTNTDIVVPKNQYWQIDSLSLEDKDRLKSKWGCTTNAYDFILMMDGRSYYFQNNTTGSKNPLNPATTLPLPLMPGTKFHIACSGGKLRVKMFKKE